MSQYTCNSCSEPISPSKARIQCQVCPAYQSCANCFVVSQVTGNHTTQHPTSLFKISGLINAPAVNDASRPTSTNAREIPSGPPPSQSYQASPSQRQLAAPVSPPPNTSPGNQRNPPSLTQQPMHLPPPSQRAAAPPQSSNWSFLFNQNATPTPLFVTLMQEMFNVLDTGRTGYLPPEAYSSFLDTQGCKPQNNIWRNAYTNAFGNNKESVADAALKSAYDTFSIEYILQPRQRTESSSVNRITSSFANLLSSSSFQSSSDMPLLTLRGFVDITTTEVLMDPSSGWSDLNRVIRYYQLPIWRAMGEIPRNMMPDVPNPIMVQRVNGVTQQRLALANQAASIQAQGNLAAVNAIGGTQWEYRRY